MIVFRVCFLDLRYSLGLRYCLGFVFRISLQLDFFLSKSLFIVVFLLKSLLPIVSLLKLCYFSNIFLAYAILLKLLAMCATFQKRSHKWSYNIFFFIKTYKYILVLDFYNYVNKSLNR
jgi:hypothetical protein